MRACSRWGFWEYVTIGATRGAEVRGLQGDQAGNPEENGVPVEKDGIDQEAEERIDDQAILDLAALAEKGMGEDHVFHSVEDLLSELRITTQGLKASQAVSGEDPGGDQSGEKGGAGLELGEKAFDGVAPAGSAILMKEREKALLGEMVAQSDSKEPQKVCFRGGERGKKREEFAESEAELVEGGGSKKAADKAGEPHTEKAAQKKGQGDDRREGDQRYRKG